MSTDDKGNYGTPLSYATFEEDNEITFTDPFGFVLSVKGIAFYDCEFGIKRNKI